MEVGAAVRGTVRQIFLEVEKAGGMVSCVSTRGFFMDTLTHVEITANAHTLYWANQAIESLN